MATGRREQKQAHVNATKTDSLWRKPITLDSFEDEDPLAMLYRGREAGEVRADEVKTSDLEAERSKPAISKSKNTGAAKKTAPASSKKEPERMETRTHNNQGSSSVSNAPKISEMELKNLLKIRSESYHFTDIREILRGKSFDIYAYLRLLSGDAGVCKIKHLDLMKKLDVSRPTLFKQGDWLVRLGLIEKRNVPGDHLGTSYIIHRLEEVLPVSEHLVKQLDSQIESFRKDTV